MPFEVAPFYVYLTRQNGTENAAKAQVRGEQQQGSDGKTSTDGKGQEQDPATAKPDAAQGGRPPSKD
jgi:hypothetical protein